MSVVRKIVGGGVAAAAALTIGALGAMPAAAATATTTAVVQSARPRGRPLPDRPSRCRPPYWLASTTTSLPLPWPRPCPIIILPPGPILLTAPVG